MKSPLALPGSPDGELRVLFVGAHSDDIEIGCGASILGLTESRSVHARWVVFSGNAERKREARLSAEAFLDRAAAKEIISHDFRESYFPAQWAEIKDAFNAIREGFEPDIVFTHYRDDRHQDHRVLSDLAWNAFRNHLILEYEIPKYDGDLGRPNFFIPVSRAQVDRKIELLESHFASQASKHWFDGETFRGLMRLRGMECASESGYSEGFHSRKAVVGL